MSEYTYSSSYTTSSPGRPYTPPHSVYLAAQRRGDALRQHLRLTSRGFGSRLTSPLFLGPSMSFLRRAWIVNASALKRA